MQLYKASFSDYLNIRKCPKEDFFDKSEQIICYSQDYNDILELTRSQAQVRHGPDRNGIIVKLLRSVICLTVTFTCL